jgi:hypothetical protein
MLETKAGEDRIVDLSTTCGGELLRRSPKTFRRTLQNRNGREQRRAALCKAAMDQKFSAVN